MKMTINDALERKTLLDVLEFSEGDFSMSKELRIKLIKNKIELEKVNAQWEEYVAQTREKVQTDDYRELQKKVDNLTADEKKRYEQLGKEAQEMFVQILNDKSKEDIDVSFNFLNSDELDEVILANSMNNKDFGNGIVLNPANYCTSFAIWFTEKRKSNKTKKDV